MTRGFAVLLALWPFAAAADEGGDLPRLTVSPEIIAGIGHGSVAGQNAEISDWPSGVTPTLGLGVQARARHVFVGARLEAMPILGASSGWGGVGEAALVVGARVGILVLDLGFGPAWSYVRMHARGGGLPAGAQPPTADWTETATGAFAQLGVGAGTDALAVMLRLHEAIFAEGYHSVRLGVDVVFTP